MLAPGSGNGELWGSVMPPKQTFGREEPRQQSVLSTWLSICNTTPNFSSPWLPKTTVMTTSGTACPSLAKVETGEKGRSLCCAATAVAQAPESHGGQRSVSTSIFPPCTRYSILGRDTHGLVHASCELLFRETHALQRRGAVITALFVLHNTCLCLTHTQQAILVWHRVCTSMLPPSAASSQPLNPSCERRHQRQRKGNVKHQHPTGGWRRCRRLVSANGQE